MQNRVFFPQAAVDQWMVDGTVDLGGNELTIQSESRRYRLADAVRVVAEVTGSPDPNELVGRVKTRTFLSELAAEILEGSMIIGDNAYDVVQGWVGTPTGTFEEHLGSPERIKKLALLSQFPPEDPRTEEDLLMRTLLKSP